MIIDGDIIALFFWNCISIWKYWNVCV